MTELLRFILYAIIRSSVALCLSTLRNFISGVDLFLDDSFASENPDQV